MIKYENDCCGCATESYPCLGNACPNINVPHLYCDECDYEILFKDETNDFETCGYSYDGDDLCLECLIERLIKEGVVCKKDYD